MKKYLFMGLLALVSLMFTACRNDDDGGSNSNPLIGNWQLKAIVLDNGQVYDITGNNVPCFKNSTLKVDATNFSFYFSVPSSQNSSECTSVTDTGTWRYENSKYYISQNGAESEFNPVFNDNNTTLQFTYGSGNNRFAFVFKK